MPTKSKLNYSPGPKDLCQTPPYALEPLLPYITKYENVWEPCAGEYILVSALEYAGHRVIAGDIQTGENFFAYTPDDRGISWDILITNPPFSRKFKIIERCFSLGKPFAILAPFDTLAAQSFQKVALTWYNKPYQIEVLAPTKRINFKMPNMGWPKKMWNEVKQKWEKRGSAQMSTCWITWGLDIEGFNKNKYANIFQCDINPVNYDENDEAVIGRRCGKSI